MTYRNARKLAYYADWPLGGKKRGACNFFVELDPKRGERVGKQTTGKPHYTTYSKRCAIIEGDDGRTYILKEIGEYAAFRVSRHDGIDHEYVHQGTAPERYAELMALMDSRQ